MVDELESMIVETGRSWHDALGILGLKIKGLEKRYHYS